MQDDSEYLATVSSPSKSFYDNILALNTCKPKKLIVSSNITFASKKPNNINKNSDISDDKYFIKECRSLFLKPGTFSIDSENPSLISHTPKKPNNPVTPIKTSHQTSTVMTSSVGKEYPTQIEKCSFPDNSVPCQHPFHPSNITDILRTPPKEVFHIKRKISSELSNNSLHISTERDLSIPFKKSKLPSDDSFQIIESNLKSRFLRYYGKYPAPHKLITRPFGRPSRDHSFTSTVVFDHILIFVIKKSFLNKNDLDSLLQVHPLYGHLHRSILHLKHLDFRPLSSFNLDYDLQKSIPFDRRMQFLACILHYNFHAGSVFRYLGNNHTNAHINPDHLFKELSNIVPNDINTYLYRALKIGAPSKINGHSPRNNFLNYLHYGNHKSITMNTPLVSKALNKEDKHNFVMHFPAWIARFIYHLHLSPEGILIKPNKNDRIVFDASFKVNYNSLSLNKSWTHAWEEPPIRYGTALLRHLIRIWNLRITYADDDILLWDDDVAGAFRLIKYNPEIAQAFSAIVQNTLWIPTGQVFGGNTSAQNFEGLALAREYLAQHLSSNKHSHLLLKHKKLLDLISYSTPSSPTDTSYTNAVPDSLNKGVLDKNGDPINTPHNMFVDDNVIAEVRSRMRQAQAASAESLFRIAGFPNPTLRRSPLSMDKYYAATCSFLKKQLGYLINTRTMYVSFPNEKFAAMLQVLNDWHKKRKSYTIKQAARLAGSLEFFASVTPWIRFVTTSLKHSIVLALRKNTQDISEDASMRTSLSDSQLLGKTFEELLRKNYALSHVLRSIWNKSTRFFISKPLRDELKLLTFIFQNRTKFSIGAPIAHIVPRDPDFNARGDACLEGAGGYSFDLKFWWFVKWPQNIVDKTLIHFNKKYKNFKGHIVSINLLEYATILISYAAAITVVNEFPLLSLHPFPLINIQTDNKSALSWTRKAASSTNEGKALARILTSMMIPSSLGLSATFIPGVDNHLADRLSRMDTQSKFISFSSLSQEYKQLHQCKRFVPSPSFLSRLWDALLLAQAHPMQQQGLLGQLHPEKNTGSNS